MTVIKLMMACNDLSLANQSLSEWKKELPPGGKARQTGAGMYFVRTQLAHLHEGLKVIEEIKNDPQLMVLIARCDGQPTARAPRLMGFVHSPCEMRR
jgi:hypothetical protein